MSIIRNPLSSWKKLSVMEFNIGTCSNTIYLELVLLSELSSFPEILESVKRVFIQQQVIMRLQVI